MRSFLPRVEVDLLEHAQEVPQPGAERVEAAEDVLLAEAELAQLAAHAPIFHPKFGHLNCSYRTNCVANYVVEM